LDDILTGAEFQTGILGDNDRCFGIASSYFRYFEKMYNQHGGNAYHPQLRADLASGIIIDKVAFHLYTEG
jgi:hypothetical protein